MTKRSRREQVLQALLELQERERLMISHDLHDGLVQDIVAAKMYLEAARENPSRQDENSQRAVELLEKALAESRRLVGDLRQRHATERDFPAALSTLIAELEKSSDVPVRASLELSLSSPSIPIHLAHIALNIVRESINNAVRHGNASEIRVEARQSDDRLYLRVEDDGVGFDPSRIEATRYGIRGIRERAELVGGRATVTSRAGEGTTVAAELPLRDPSS